MKSKIPFSNPLAALIVVSGLSVVLSPMSTALAAPPSTVRASVSSTGGEGDNVSSWNSISANGRFVEFFSSASNLVSGDNNGTGDIFVHDFKTGVTQRVSVSSAGVEGNSFSYGSSISPDGRFMGFYSFASNLVEGDNNGTADIFVHELETGVTQRVSVSSTGEEGNGSSYNPSISANNRFVAFASEASNLVLGDNNGTGDTFIRDLKTGITQRVSVSSTREEGNNNSYTPSISTNGRFVSYYSDASNLVSGDNNAASDTFIYDLKTGVTQRISISSTGSEGNSGSYDASISANGRFVAFYSEASNLVSGDNNSTGDIFIRDLKTGVTRRVSVSSIGDEGNSLSYAPYISANGRFVAFYSDASNLVSGDNNAARDIFVHKLETGVTQRVSVSRTGEEGNGYSYNPSISATGRFVAFYSDASNLVPGDNNAVADIFVRRRW